MTDLAPKIKKPKIKLQINDGYRFVNDIVKTDSSKYSDYLDIPSFVRKQID